MLCFSTIAEKILTIILKFFARVSLDLCLNRLPICRRCCCYCCGRRGDFRCPSSFPRELSSSWSSAPPTTPACRSSTVRAAEKVQPFAGWPQEVEN